MLARLMVAAAASIALVCAGGTSVVAQTPLRAVIGGPGFFYTMHYVAVAGGFFKQEGLDAETIVVASGPRQVAAITGGSADIAPTNLEHVVRMNLQGGSMVAVAALYDIFPMTVVLSNKAIAKVGITDGMSVDDKVKRLNGLRMGITTSGSGTDSMLRNIFLARGLVPDKEVTILPLGTPDSMLAALEKGIADGFVYPSPHADVPARRGYGKAVIDPFTREVPELRDVPYIVLLTSRENLESKAPLIKASVRAYTRAIKFAHENPEAARKLTRPYLKEIDESVFNAAFDKYFKGIPQTPVISPEQLAKTISWMNFSEKAPISMKYQDAVFPDFAREAAKDILGK